MYAKPAELPRPGLQAKDRMAEDSRIGWPAQFFSHSSDLFVVVVYVLYAYWTTGLTTTYTVYTVHPLIQQLRATLYMHSAV
jgi:hypothetical protein